MNAAAGSGWAGSAMSIACNPAECHVTRATLGVSVGLCDEKLARLSRMGSTEAQIAGSLLGSLYSAAMRGAAGSEMSMNRVQPHGQPCAASTPPSLP